MSSRRRRRFRRGSDTGRGSRDSVIGKLQGRVRARWETMDRTGRGAALGSRVSGESVIGKLQARVRARWETMGRTARGAALVSLGSVTLVVMAMLVKAVG